MGNSEVGHVNLGAGRIVYQDLTRLDVEIKDRSAHRIRPRARGVGRRDDRLPDLGQDRRGRRQPA